MVRNQAVTPVDLPSFGPKQETSATQAPTMPSASSLGLLNVAHDEIFTKELVEDLYIRFEEDLQEFTTYPTVVFEHIVSNFRKSHGFGRHISSGLKTLKNNKATISEPDRDQAKESEESIVCDSCTLHSERHRDITRRVQSQIKERDEIIENQKKELQIKGKKLQQKEAELHKKEAMLQAEITLCLEKTVLVGIRDSTISQKYAELLDLKRTLRDRDASIEKVHHRLNDQEDIDMVSGVTSRDDELNQSLVELGLVINRLEQRGASFTKPRLEGEATTMKEAMTAQIEEIELKDETIISENDKAISKTSGPKKPKKKMTILRDKLSAAEAEISQLKDRIVEQEQDIDDKDATIATKDQDTQELESSLLMRITALEEDIEEKEEGLAKADEGLAKAGEEIEEQAEVAITQDKIIEDISQRLQEREDSIIEMKGQLEAMKAKIATKDDQLKMVEDGFAQKDKIIKEKDEIIAARDQKIQEYLHRNTEVGSSTHQASHSAKGNKDCIPPTNEGVEKTEIPQKPSISDVSFLDFWEQFKGKGLPPSNTGPSHQ